MTIAETISQPANNGDPYVASHVNTPTTALLSIHNDFANGLKSAEVLRLDEITSTSAPASGKWKLYCKSGGLYLQDDAGLESLIGGPTFLPTFSQSGKCQFRMSLTDAEPVPTADQTAATTLYIVPFGGNHVSIWNISDARWVEYESDQITVDISAFTADTNYDIFLKQTAGVVQAASAVWASATSRGFSLSLQDGVYCKAADIEQLYLGTIRITSVTGQCEDSATKRYVWNNYHRRLRRMYKIDTTDSWTYATASWRSKNNSTANRFEFVLGIAEEPVRLRNYSAAATSAVNAVVGWGIDSTTVVSGIYPLHQDAVGTLVAEYFALPAVGYHYAQALEYASGATVTYYGDAGVSYIQTGMYGEVWA